MRLLSVILLSLTFACLASGQSSAPLTAAEIMKKVAANQDLAQTERTRYLYEQHVKVTVRRANGKLMREEISDLAVTPGAKGVEKKQQSLYGRYWKKDRYLEFKGESESDSDGLDKSLAKSFRDDLLNDNSKDGIAKDLFPLTTEEQKDLEFELEGELMVSGRPAYRIKFGPADRHDITWAGEAVIDKEEFQPFSVYTRLSRRLPLLVRGLLGTDLPGLGFSEQYKRLDTGVWFPVSFGTEFRLHAVFFINRTITMSMENKNFKRASAESEIKYGETAPEESGPR